jgi:hypothetical protein
VHSVSLSSVVATEKRPKSNVLQISPARRGSDSDAFRRIFFVVFPTIMNIIFCNLRRVYWTRSHLARSLGRAPFWRVEDFPQPCAKISFPSCPRCRTELQHHPSCAMHPVVLTDFDFPKRKKGSAFARQSPPSSQATWSNLKEFQC